METIEELLKVINISVCSPDLSTKGSEIKEQKRTSNVRVFYKDYLDTYQFSNGRFKLCFYILVDNGLNVLLQICIFLKEVVCKYLAW